MKHFSFLLKPVAALLLFLPVNQEAKAQVVGGNHFLQGNYIEVGIAPNGSFGSTVGAPIGYHPRVTTPTPGAQLGFVADAAKDGWSVGTPNYHGDFFLPGTPQEGWGISSGFSESQAYRQSGGMTYTGPLFGANIGIDDSPTESIATWQGMFMSTLQVTQQTRIIKTKTYFTVRVVMKNTGTTTMSDIYYARTVDPDNDVSLTGSFTTINKIEYTIPNPGNKVLVRAIDPTYVEGYLGLGTMDCRAKPFIHKSGLTPSHPYKTMYDAPPSSSYYFTQGDTYTNDVGYSIVYKIGNILPGDSAIITYAYILNQADMEEALLQTLPTWTASGSSYDKQDTLVLSSCSLPVTIPLTIENGNQYLWTWSATGAILSEDTGTNITAIITGPAVITAIGAGVCGNDTFTLHVVSPSTTPMPAVVSPITYCQGDPAVPLQATGTALLWYTSATTMISSPTAPTPPTSTAGTFTWYVSQNLAGCESPRAPIQVTVHPTKTTSLDATICNGETYTYNGTVYSASGSYVHHYLTDKGCDSSVILNLVVKPTYNHTIYTTTCNGASYNFAGVAYSTSGAYAHNFYSNLGCDSVVTLVLTAINIPPSSFNDTICQGETYTWAGGVHTTTGSYLYTFTSPTGCDSVVTLNLTVNPTYERTVYASICEGKQYTFAGQQYGSSGQYPVALTTIRGCDSLLTLYLSVTPAPVTSRKDTICEGASFEIGSSVLTETGYYQVRLKTPGGCDSIVNVNLYVWPNPDQQFRLPSDGCINELQEIKMVRTNVNQGEQFNWNFDGGSVKYGTGGGPFGIIWQETGWQYVTLERPNNFGCPTNPVRDSIYIHPLPIAKILATDPQYCAWDTVLLTAQLQQGYQYQWEPAGILTEDPTGNTANMRVQGNRWYHVTVKDGFCQNSDSLFIPTENCCTLELPTAFTPNGDGKNDVFRPVAKGNQEIAIFRVVNRWGQVIYESHSQHKGWDGTLNGVPQDIGNYMYFLRYKCADGQYYEKQGDVTLLR